MMKIIKKRKKRGKKKKMKVNIILFNYYFYVIPNTKIYNTLIINFNFIRIIL